jgi:hypothetical protein
MEKFGLNNITKYYITDNASAMIKASASDDWISCAAHNLNLVQFHSFKNLGNNSALCKANLLIYNCKELVSYAKRSGLQNLLSLTLKQSIDVRWDSELIMLESIKKNYSQLSTLAQNNLTLLKFLENINESLLSALINLLTPFFTQRLALCEESSPTFHLVLPTKKSLLKHCQIKDSDSMIIKSLKEKLPENLNKYFKTTETHFAATVLYPACKSLRNLANEDEKRDAIQLLKNLAKNIIVSNQSITITIVTNTTVDECFKDFLEVSYQLDANSDIESSSLEVEKYLSGSVICSPNVNNKLEKVLKPNILDFMLFPKSY